MPEQSPAVPDTWRRSYSHVFQLSGLGVAWEFLRRNAKLERAWCDLKPTWQETLGDHDVTIIRDVADNKPARPCFWASSVDQDATSATVVWNPRETRHVLKVVAAPPKLSFGGQVFDLELIAVEKTLYVDLAGRQQLLLRDGSHSLQLDIRGTPLTEPVTLLVDAAVPEDRPEIQLHLLQCFRELRASGTLTGHCFPPHSYAKRATSVLIALDGYLAGITHRNIAIAMFGKERVDRDWSDPGEHLRDAVRRAIARGVSLMEGGYRMFLR